MYINPDLEEQIEFNHGGVYSMSDMDDLARVVRKTEKATLMNRWTTETADNIPSASLVNYETLKMELGL